MHDAGGDEADTWFTLGGSIALARSDAETEIVIGWWMGAPWDVRAYAAGHPTHPTDYTLEQLYDSAEFDAYRELGACSVKLALQESMPGRRSGTAVADVVGTR